MQPLFYFFFFFNDTATTEIYTLSLHDALPIYTWPGATRSEMRHELTMVLRRDVSRTRSPSSSPSSRASRSEEHTSELQSLAYLVCRLLLEKKKKTDNRPRQTGAHRHLIPVYHT